MTSEITNILDSIAATGATESSDPLREYILALEQSNAALKNDNEGLQATLVSAVGNATAPLELQITNLGLELTAKVTRVTELEAIILAIREALPPLE